MPPETPKDTEKTKTKKKVQYSNEDLMKALDEIRIHGKGLRETAKAFGIPPTTLHDRLSGKRGVIVRSSGPDPVLGVEGEKSVKDWLIGIAKCGFPVKKDELLDTVQKIVRDNGTTNPFKDDRPGQTWYRNFLKRHPELSVRTAEGINKARARITEESIRTWFRELEAFLTETNNQDILNSPERLFNSDESGFSLCPKTGKVLGPKGYRNLYQIKSGNEKDNLTVLVTFNAKGQVCPPLVVFPYVRPPRAVVESMPDEWCLGKSESGWMRADVFFEYITNEFNNWVERNQIKKPVLLLVDGHKSHMSLVLSAMCEQQQIILYALPPNTTHMLQPADVSVFGPLKSSWKTVVRQFLSKPENVNFCVTKTNFCKLFKETLDDTNMEQNIGNGFRRCGLYPFNPDAVDYTKCVQNTLENLNRRPIVDDNEISNEDLDITKKVLKYLRPVLKQKKINVGVILKEVRKLRKPDTSSVSTEIESEGDKTGSINLSSSLQMEYSTEGVHISELSPHTSITDTVEASKRTMNTATDTEILPPLMLEKPQESQDQTHDGDSAVITIITTADVHCAPPSILTHIDFDEILPYSDDTEDKREKKKDVTPVDSSLREISPLPEETEKKHKLMLNANVSLPPHSSFDEILQDLPYPEETDQEQKRDISLPSVSPPLDEVLAEPDNTEKTYSLPDDSLSTLHLTGTGVSSYLDVGSIVSLDDVIMIPSQLNTPNSDSSAFSKHLFIPEPPERAKAKQVRTPSAISSSAWRKYYEDKENVKLQKQAATRKRQLERSEQQKQKKMKKEQTPKTKGRKGRGKKKSETIMKELCSQCEHILISDTEDDEEKNLGCDHCPRWYHLKCTLFAGSSYTDVKDESFRCHACVVDED